MRAALGRMSPIAPVSPGTGEHNHASEALGEASP